MDLSRCSSRLLWFSFFLLLAVATLPFLLYPLITAALQDPRPQTSSPSSWINMQTGQIYRHPLPLIVGQHSYPETVFRDRDLLLSLKIHPYRESHGRNSPPADLERFYRKTPQRDEFDRDGVTVVRRYTLSPRYSIEALRTQAVKELVAEGGKAMTSAASNVQRTRIRAWYRDTRAIIVACKDYDRLARMFPFRAPPDLSTGGQGNG